MFICGCLVSLKIEQVAGYYECKECDNKYVPTYKAINSSLYMRRKRYMKCPRCNKRSWNKKVISMNNKKIMWLISHYFFKESFSENKKHKIKFYNKDYLMYNIIKLK